MELKAYKTGSPFPEFTDKKVRLYSMRFCPYSHRVRLVLASKKIDYETININSKYKPEWFNQIESYGMTLTHPILYDNGKLVHESLIICEYLDNVYPQNKLITTQGYTKARHQMLIEAFARVAQFLYKSVKYKDPEAFNEIFKILNNFESFLSDNYFGGKSVGFTDLMIWPWFERFHCLRSLTNNEITSGKYPKLTKWVQRMNNLEAVKETATDEEVMIKYYKTLLSGKEVDYDIGLPGLPEPEEPEEAAEEKVAEELKVLTVE